MLIIGAFAIYVIIKERVQITRNLVLTGQRARNFGICLLVIILPLSLTFNRVLDVLPERLSENPVAANIFALLVFAAVSFVLAILFRSSHA